MNWFGEVNDGVLVLVLFMNIHLLHCAVHEWTVGIDLLEIFFSIQSHLFTLNIPRPLYLWQGTSIPIPLVYSIWTQSFS